MDGLEIALLRGSAPARLVVVAVALLVTAPGVCAEDPKAIPPASATEAQKKLELQRAELEGKELRGRELQKSVTDIDTEREQINARLLETAALVQASEAKLTAIEARLGELEAQETQLRGTLSERYGHISTLLAALQRMGRNPPPVIITRREDALKMVRSAMLLATAFPEMRVQALALADKLNQLVRIMTDIRTEGDRLKTETERLNDMQTRLSGLLVTKKQTLEERKAELAVARKASAEIAERVSGLNDLIAKLNEEMSKNAELQAYEREVERQAAATPPPAAVTPPSPEAKPDAPDVSPGPDGAQRSPALPADPGIIPPPDPPGTAVVELVPVGTSLVPGSPGRIKPAIPFHLAKAKLPLPAQGRRALTYGEKTQYGGNSKGLVIETRIGARVTSPCDGWIVYAGEFRSYGQLLIINAGGGYHVLVAGLSQIDVQPGQFVLTAEPVGTMSGPPRTAAGATQDSAQSSSPVLYVEFRKDGQPIDPEPWWVISHQKVQE